MTPTLAAFIMGFALGAGSFWLVLQLAYSLGIVEHRGYQPRPAGGPVLPPPRRP